MTSKQFFIVVCLSFVAALVSYYLGYRAGNEAISAQYKVELIYDSIPVPVPIDSIIVTKKDTLVYDTVKFPFYNHSFQNSDIRINWNSLVKPDTLLITSLDYSILRPTTIIKPTYHTLTLGVMYGDATAAPYLSYHYKKLNIQAAYINNKPFIGAGYNFNLSKP